jgi:hypothetical protein
MMCMSLVGLFFVSAAAAEQPAQRAKLGLLVITIEGATCRLERDGKEIIEFLEPGAGDKLTAHQIEIEPSPSHRDIVATCWKDGYVQESETLSFGPQTWIADSAPCAPPTGSTDEEIQKYCAGYKSVTTGVTMAYPGVVRLLLIRKS